MAPHTSELNQILSDNRETIARDWAALVQAQPGGHYGEYPAEEVRVWADRALETLQGVLEDKDNPDLEIYLEGITRTRLEAGFEISDVIEALLIGADVIDPHILRASLSEPARTQDMGAQLDAALRRIVSRLGQLYARAIEQRFLDETHRRLGESESLQRTTTALLQKLTLDEVLEIVCTEAQRLTGAAGSSVLLLEEQNWLKVTIAIGSPRPALDRIPVTDSIAGLVVLDSQPRRLSGPTDKIQVYHRNPDLLSLLVLPLQIQEVSIGALDLVNKPGGFTDEDARLMGLFADQAAIAIENARLHEQAEQLAVLEERQRLARDLHDSVTQSLYSVTLYADAARMALSAGKVDQTAEHLKVLREMTLEAMLDMRLLIFELHPPILEKEGLVAAIRTRLESVEARSGIKTSFEVLGDRRLSLPVESELYRIAQEALTNVVKHARAQEVAVEIVFEERCFRLEILDNGVGFDLEAIDGEGRMGLRGIRERVRVLNGELNVSSTQGEGTKLTVVVEL